MSEGEGTLTIVESQMAFTCALLRACASSSDSTAFETVFICALPSVHIGFSGGGLHAAAGLALPVYAQPVFRRESGIECGGLAAVYANVVVTGIYLEVALDGGTANQRVHRKGERDLSSTL